MAEQKSTRKRLTVEERFWAKVQKTDTCWLWTACVVRGGYGLFMVRHGEAWMAHKYAYHLTGGIVPEGLILMHACDVPNCVNPAHLVVGT